MFLIFVFGCCDFIIILIVSFNLYVVLFYVFDSVFLLMMCFIILIVVEIL